MLERYMMENDVFIDYLLIDYFIDILYQGNPKFRLMIDGMQYTQPHLHDLRLMYDDSFDEMKWRGMLAKTNIYKLTYKGSHTEYDNNGSPTFYGHILNCPPS